MNWKRNGPHAVGEVSNLAGPSAPVCCVLIVVESIMIGCAFLRIERRCEVPPSTPISKFA